MTTALNSSSTTELRYLLSEEDYINCELYYTSKDNNFQKQRIKDKYRIIGLSLLCALILFFDGDYEIYAYYFLGSAVILFIIYPWWSKIFYKRMIKSRLTNKYKNSFPQNIGLTLYDKSIELRNSSYIQTFEIYTIKEIIEIQDYFFIQRSNVPPIIIPKKETPDIEPIRERLQQYKTDFNIAFINDEEYKWK